jgi:L-ascorbate metabolism protein UlaG (beta-lactamase superfamily)
MHSFASLKVPNGAVGIHWFGQSSFALKDADGTIVQVDPYFPTERPADRFIHAEPPLDETTLPTDFVLLTHNHRDHTLPESCIRIHAAFPNCRFVGPEESTANLAQSGIPQDRLTTVVVGQSVTLGTMQAHVVWAKPPDGVPADDIKPPDVQHFGYVVVASGVNVYISGDPINTFANHDDLIAPIKALNPHIGFLTTHPSEGEFPYFDGSVQMAMKLGLKTAVPAHYQCFVARNYDPQQWSEQFPADGPDRLIIPYDDAVIYRA